MENESHQLNRGDGLENQTTFTATHSDSHAATEKLLPRCLRTAAVGPAGFACPVNGSV